MKIFQAGFFGGIIFFLLWLAIKVFRDLQTIHMALEVQREINRINNECGIRADAKIDKILKTVTADKKDTRPKYDFTIPSIITRESE